VIPGAPDIATLGIAGFCIVSMVGFGFWFIRGMSVGNIYTKSQVDRLLAEKDKTIAEKNDVIDSEREARKEWRDTALTSEAGRVLSDQVAKAATEQNRLLDYFFNQVMPKRAEGGHD
jgi:hypothetical protein